MEKIRTIIVDDEPLAREGIRLLVGNDPQIEVVGECSTGQEAATKIQCLSPDLVFLDVQMPEMNGFEALARVGAEQMPTIVFVTAYDQYALKAFEAQALDYLLKPFSDERFYKTLARAKSQLEQRKAKEENRNLQALLEQYQIDQNSTAQETTLRSGASRHLDRLIIKSGGHIAFLDIDEIDWIEAADYCVLLHVGWKSHLLRERLTELESKLDPQKFLRIHRSTIVNIARIRELQGRSSGSYDVMLRDGTKLRLSRRRREILQAVLKQFE